MSDKLEAPFEREERYIVIKRKHLDEITECAIRTGLNGYRVNTVECVVVESDWPEYETVWRMIEDRVTGRDGGHRAAMVRAFEASGWSSLLAEKQADIALSVFRTPTPEQAGEVERDEIIASIIDPIAMSEKYIGNREANGDVGFMVRRHARRAAALSKAALIREALQSTPPAQPTEVQSGAAAFHESPVSSKVAQPTADAVERALKAFNGGLVDLPDSNNARGYTTYFRPKEAMAKALATMAGDYVMVPRESTDEICEAIASEANCCGGIADTIWNKAIAAARDDIAFAINGAWNEQGGVPFPLDQSEAEALADAAIKAVIEAGGHLTAASPTGGE